MVESTNNSDILVEARQLVPEGETQAINLQLQRDDTLCLIGPDTTRLYHYLRTLAGVTPPQRGELRLLGVPLRDLDKQRWREQRQQIGFVARGAPILSVLRGLDNVMLPALYHKRMSRPEAQNRALELIAQLGCSGDIHKLPAYLSQQQRLQLAIARATILDPAMLFMEEPFFGLSLAEQQPIYQYFVSVAKQRALILSTQNLRLVKELATQILFIGERAVQSFDSWLELTQSRDNEIVSYLSEYQQQYQLI